MYPIPHSPPPKTSPPAEPPSLSDKQNIAGLLVLVSIILQKSFSHFLLQVNVTGTHNKEDEQQKMYTVWLYVITIYRLS